MSNSDIITIDTSVIVFALTVAVVVMAEAGKLTRRVLFVLVCSAACMTVFVVWCNPWAIGLAFRTRILVCVVLSLGVLGFYGWFAKWTSSGKLDSEIIAHPMVSVEATVILGPKATLLKHTENLAKEIYSMLKKERWSDDHQVDYLYGSQFKNRVDDVINRYEQFGIKDEVLESHARHQIQTKKGVHNIADILLLCAKNLSDQKTVKLD